MTTWPVQMLFSAWDDLDRALSNVSEIDATRSLFGGSSFAWTLAHVTQGVDSWINVRFRGLEPNELVSQARFRFGADGVATDIREIRDAVSTVRSSARPYLRGLNDDDLDLTLPYDGSYVAFRQAGIQLRAAIVQNAVHHMYHVGEIVSKRELLGQEPGTFPGTALTL